MATRNRDVTKRVHFFERQFLRAQDFVDEQDYHLDRRHRHNRALHGAGIVEGLIVDRKAGSPEEVTVLTGWAIDPEGREIVLTGGHDLTVSEDVTIHISYPDPEPLADESTDPGVTGFTRVHERAALTQVATGTTPPAGTLPLAVVTVDPDGNVDTIDNDVRQVLGSAAPDSGGSTIPPGGVDADMLSTGAVTPRAIVDDAVTLAKLGPDVVAGAGVPIGNDAVAIRHLKTSLVLDTAVIVPPAPEKAAVSIETLSGPAFYLISVSPVAASSPKVARAPSAADRITWKQVMEFSPEAPQLFNHLLELETGGPEMEVQVVVHRLW